MPAWMIFLLPPAMASIVAATVQAGATSTDALTLAQEIGPAYLAWARRPAAELSVFDAITDLDACMQRTGANAVVSMWSVGIDEAEDGDGRAFVYNQGLHERMLEAKSLAEEKNVRITVFAGDRNNPFFTYYPVSYQEAFPEAFMLDPEGRRIAVVQNPIRNQVNPAPAVDDAQLLDLGAGVVRLATDVFAGDPHLSAWVTGTEEAYPDYFGLPLGDFREASLDHYSAYVAQRGWNIEPDPDRIAADEYTREKAAWYLFRDQAMADRAAFYMQAFLEGDQTRPVLYPTHGHPFSGVKRRELGQPAELLTGAVDGLEMGHIVIDDDLERLNLVYFSHYASYGNPLIVPRLGNKTLDAEARGGGRSFTPAMLRRLIYECVGMGAWHIGPIHWRATLGDGEWFIKDTPAESECRSVFAELRNAAPILERMGRLQPRVGLIVGQDEWSRGWNPKWTGLFHDALASQWHIALASDVLLDDALARRMPALIAIDLAHLARASRDRLVRYLDAGGRLYVSGPFATQDELGTAYEDAAEFLGRPQITVLAESTGTSARVLCNWFQTGDGAYHRAFSYSPVDFSAVQEAVLRDFPEAAARPVRVSAPRLGDVNVLPLTDGASLACVLINMADEAQTAQVAPQSTTWFDGRAWAAFDIVASKPMPRNADGTVGVALAPRGTALVWYYPETGAEDAAAEAETAQATLDRWATLGVDVSAWQHASRSLLDDSDSPWGAAKAFCLARAVGRSVGVRLDVSSEGNGLESVTARIYDAEGRPVDDAAVRVRITPGPFTWRPAVLSGTGEYRLALAPSDLPRVYNFVHRRYEPVAGPVRIVISAERGTARGGAMCVVHRP